MSLLPAKLSDVYVDGIKLDRLQRVLSGLAADDDSDRYWATPERDEDDGTGEVLEWNFPAAKPVNYINFEVAHFPQDVNVEYFDESRRLWLSVRSEQVNESRPERINAVVGVDDQHRGHDHWLPIGGRCTPVVAKRWRIVCRRRKGRAPTNRLGFKLSFSLAIRRLEIGFRVTRIQDCPRQPPAAPFVQTIDVLGSTVTYTLRTIPASGVAAGQTWLCAPQATSDSVVNFYVDVRTPTGGPQRVDRFTLDPVHIGPSMNLYWSNDEPESSFDSRDDAIDTTQVGVVSHDEFGAVFDSAAPSGIEILSERIQFDPGRPFWVGGRFTPTYNPAAATVRPVLDLGAIWLQLGNGKLTLRTQTQTLDVAVPGLVSGTAVTFAAGSDPGGLWLTVEDYGERRSMSPLTGVTRPQIIVLGGHLPGRSPAATSGQLGMLVLKAEVLTGQTVSSFFADPDPFARRPTFPTENDPTENALARYHPEHRDVADHGVVGGIPDRFADMAWTPIARDHSLRKGVVEVPPTVAKFWKFEFSNLVAQPYESFLPIRRQVRRQIPTLPVPTPSGPGHPQPGRRTMFELITTLRFTDTPLFSIQASVGLGAGGFSAGVRVSLGGASRTTTTIRTVRSPEIARSPTEVCYVKDPSIALSLRLASWAHGYQRWHCDPIPVQQPQTIIHRYDETTVEHRSKVAFFVGLKAISAAAINYLADDDTAAYRERFDAPVTVESSNWVLQDGRLETQSGGEVATSKVLGSTHRVAAVQVASRQTQPLQIAPDDDFRDPTLATSSWSELELWHVVGNAVPTYLPETHSVRLDRGEDAAPEYLPVTGGLAQQPDHPTFAIRALFGGGIIQTNLGGLESALIRPSGPGRIYAAARVLLDTTLTLPLYVQIIARDGTILAEESKSGRKGEVLEWFVGHSVATIVAPRPNSSGLVDAPDHPLLTDATSTGGPSPLDDHVRVRLIQKGETGDRFTVDTLSLFDEAIEWEFSNDGGAVWVPVLDARNNAYGIVSFPNPDKRLRWRVFGHRPNLSIASLTMRPLYLGRPVGDAWKQSGPNMSPYDQLPPISADPEFTGWSSPIPQSWYAKYRQEGLVGLNFVRLRVGRDQVVTADAASRAASYIRTGTDSVAVADVLTHAHDYETIIQPPLHIPDEIQ